MTYEWNTFVHVNENEKFTIIFQLKFDCSKQTEPKWKEPKTYAIRVAIVSCWVKDVFWNRWNVI